MVLIAVHSTSPRLFGGRTQTILAAKKTRTQHPTVKSSRTAMARRIHLFFLVFRSARTNLAAETEANMTPQWQEPRLCRIYASARSALPPCLGVSWLN